MNELRKISMIICAGAAVLPAMAQKTSYTLEECRSMALAENAKVKISMNELSASRQEKKEVMTNFFPSVSVSGVGMIADDNLLELTLAPGMSMGLVKDGIGIGVSAMQPIYAGGQIYNGSKLAKIGVEVNELKLRQTENEVCKTVEQYYWQIVVLEEKLRTLEAVGNQLDRISSDVAAAVDAGVRTRNDALQVELRRNDIRSTRVNVENTLALCNMLLAQFVGVDAGDFEVASSIGDIEIESPKSLLTDHSAALSATAEYQLLTKNVDANRLQQRMALGEHLPKVAIGGMYLYNDFLGTSKNSVLGMVSVSIPISWKAPYSVRKQKMRLQNSIIQLDDGSEQLVIRMQKAWNDLNNAYEQILIAEYSIEQSSENLRLNEDYYNAGTIGMSDLMDAQTMFQQSHDKYAEACAQYAVCRMEYLEATGRLK